ncbi:glutathione S-transferase C-terminal-like protein [Trametes meyenii]|nr:glutathione S-transferase C-terminal-like protein [Trametes meyenii]
MATISKPLTLYGNMGPNPMKVRFVLEELGLEYDIVEIDITTGAHKAPAYVQVNPNGRIPALVDHANGDFTIWESNAIILYLLDRYDPERKLGVADANDKHTLLQWLFFQASGQGPYYGQVAWFARYHPERVPSAVERYQKETVRVIGVLDGVLATQEWLVGGKLTAADLSFVPWNEAALVRYLKDLEGVDVGKQYPAFFKWHKKLINRPTAQKIYQEAQARRASAQ